MQFALFLTAMAWAAAANFIAARSAQGIAVRFQAGQIGPLLENLFLVFLLVVGLRLLDRIATRGAYPAEILSLPRRTGWPSEFGLGAAIGWGLCVVAALPLLLSGHLHARLSWQSGTGTAATLALLTLLAGTLTQEVIFRGYAFRRLTSALGPTTAALLLSLLSALLLVQANPPRNPGFALLDSALLGLLLALAWLRTHALWLGWGLHFAYRAVAAVILGLPIAGQDQFGSPTDMNASGPRWLSGGAFGLDAALFTAFVLLLGMAILYRETRDYAWQYTHAPIVSGGYEVTVAPPAAHLAMEKAAPPPPLVQILPSTPQSRSALDPPTHGSG